MTEVFAVRMRTRDEIRLHAHTTPISLAMMVLPDADAIHVSVDASTKRRAHHRLRPGWGMLNLGPTLHAVTPAHKDRITIVWNASLR